MIWFSCKKCGKTHGRPEGSIGSMVFCDCGQGNLVPWESTAVPPPEASAPPPAAHPAGPALEPMSFDDDPPRRGSRRPRRRGRYAPDPNFCLNHETLPSQQTCADCGESFCGDCAVMFEGVTLCGPCKNYRVRAMQQPPRLSAMALVSLLLALVTGPLALCLIGAGGNLWSLLAVVPHLIALCLGALALRDTERDPKIGGRSLALTGILMAVLSASLTLVLTFFAPGILT